MLWIVMFMPLTDASGSILSSWSTLERRKLKGTSRYSARMYTHSCISNAHDTLMAVVLLYEFVCGVH